MKSKLNKEPFGTDFPNSYSNPCNNNTWRVGTRRESWLSFPDLKFKVKFSLIELLYEESENVLLLLLSNGYKLWVNKTDTSIISISLELKVIDIYLNESSYTEFKNTIYGCFK